MTRTLRLLALASCAALAFGQGIERETGGGQGDDGNGNGKAVHETKPQHEASYFRFGSGQIMYHGGPVMTGGPTVYYIWYGNWTGNTAVGILENLARNIGGTPYFNINTTYYNASSVHVLNWVGFGGSTTDNYSQGKSLSDAQVQAVVNSAITSGRLPANPNGVYFVLTSADVAETSGFCSYYCGWHTYGTIAGSNIKYAFVGNPDRCPSACEAQSTGPNGNAGADGMASIIAHELEEATTDPNLNAWYDWRGYENADKCAWTYGTVSKASNGAYYNVTWGGLNYLIQQNWVNSSSGYCAMSH